MSESDSTILYGYCHCGCGDKTAIAKKTKAVLGHIQGEPVDYILGHYAQALLAQRACEYRWHWEVERPDIPYGECWCGCGKQTRISPFTKKNEGYVQGEPRCYIVGHYAEQARKAVMFEHRRRWEQEAPDIPYGYCWCGCGEKTPIATHTSNARDRIEGAPSRFCMAHGTFKREIPCRVSLSGDPSVSTALSLVTFRACLRCGCTKPLNSTFFRWVKKREYSSGGYFARTCCICRRLDGYNYYHETDKLREYSRLWARKFREENPELAKEKWQEWVRKNPEKMLAKGRRANKRKRQLLQEDEQALQKERARQRAKQEARRALKKGSGGSYAVADIQQMYEDQGGLCAYCECSLDGRYHIEHMIPLSRGGSNDALNIALTCPECNVRKGDKTAEEFFATV